MNREYYLNQRKSKERVREKEGRMGGGRVREGEREEGRHHWILMRILFRPEGKDIHY